MWLPLVLACTKADPSDSDHLGHDSDEPAIDADEAALNFASGPGDFAADLLRADPYDHVVVEVDYVVSWEPGAEELDRIVATVEDLCNKPGGVDVIVDDELPAQGSPAWSVAAADDLEAAYRDRYRDADDGTAVIYALWLDGHSDRDNSDAQVLGYAVHGSSLVMYGETIDANSGGLLSPPIAPVVAAHEVGHLLGLVNTGTPMVDDHEDPDHRAHDVNDGCLMYWAVETSNVVDMLLGGEPDFDAACRADVAAAGGAG
jgi:hypothetical protein